MTGSGSPCRRRRIKCYVGRTSSDRLLRLLVATRVRSCAEKMSSIPRHRPRMSNSTASHRRPAGDSASRHVPTWCPNRPTPSTRPIRPAQVSRSCCHYQRQKWPCVVRVPSLAPRLGDERSAWYCFSRTLYCSTRPVGAGVITAPLPLDAGLDETPWCELTAGFRPAPRPAVP